MLNQVIPSIQIKKLVIEYLKDLVNHAHGNLVTFRPAKIGNDLKLKFKSEKGVNTIIRSFLVELEDLGLIVTIKKTARGVVYGIFKNHVKEIDVKKSPLFWKLLQEFSTDEILYIIDKLHKSDITFGELVLSLIRT